MSLNENNAQALWWISRPPSCLTLRTEVSVDGSEPEGLEVLDLSQCDSAYGGNYLRWEGKETHKSGCWVCPVVGMNKRTCWRESPRTGGYSVYASMDDLCWPENSRLLRAAVFPLVLHFLQSASLGHTASIYGILLFLLAMRVLIR